MSRLIVLSNCIFLWIIVLSCLPAYAQLNNRITDTSSYKVSWAPFNTTASEYSPYFYKNGIIFCSNRENNLGVVYTSEYTDLPLGDIYYTEKIDTTRWKKPTGLSKIINSKYAEGPASFTENGDIIYFTRIETLGDNTKLHIYASYIENGNWTEPFYLPINKEKYSCGHPAIASSGNFMIFVSDMAGGLGGTDLYITYLKEGKWTKPQNLGRPINTPGNEITPFIHENNVLYFASDGHKGNGGFDIYNVYYNQFEWKGLKNIGHPFNTSFNDYGFVIDKDLLHGYFTSNRLKGGDDDDIYSFGKSDESFQRCDTMPDRSLCRTFFEEGTVPAESMPLVYEWSFGDGNKKRGNEVRHCYSKPGDYTIQLNVVDLISNQVFLNEATYKMTLEPINTAYFETRDTLMVGKEYVFDGAKSVIPGSKPKSYLWDFGTGQTFSKQTNNYTFNVPGVYNIKLNYTAIDSLGKPARSCVSKDLIVISKEEWDESLKKAKKPQAISLVAKTIYSIRDSEGNEYKIQVATSEKSIKHKFKKIEGVVNVEEYFDRNVYGYTTGNFKNPVEAYPVLKKMRRIGFKEAVLIATKDGNVISGNDSSFFINLPETFVPIKIVNMRGKIVDKDGNKLAANLRWESLTLNDELGNIVCENPVGEYNINLPDGDLYGYYASYKDLYPTSNHIDLRLENDITEIISDIVLYDLKELATESLPIKINNIFFSPDKYEIQPESHTQLERLAIFIKENPNYRFEIAGHTDHTGGDQYNLSLSQKRANAVLNYLVKVGCPSKSLVAKGYGNTKPATTNKKLIELNRRVEFKVYQTN